jgi:prepilin-type N-terminal cleavage/methylation domain-containing protein
MHVRDTGLGSRLRVRGRSKGFTLIEVAVALAIIGVMTALAAPLAQQWAADQRVRAAARSVADAFTLARSEAIRTGNAQIVFLGICDPAFVAPIPAWCPLMVDANANPVPILILNDGRPGTPGQNCQINLPLGKPRRTIRAEAGVNWGFTFAGGTRAPDDPGTGPMASGTSLVDAAGNAVQHVMFRPDGIPVGLSAACTAGGVGTGGGAVYVTNGTRDYAVVLSPLGGVRVHAFDRTTNAWRN